MGAYKKLNKQDAYITTYTAHKSWTVLGSEFDTYGISLLPYTSGSYSSSIAQLYYPKKVSGSLVSHSFDYYESTTLDNPQLRNYNANASVISIPRALTGVNIKPGVSVNFFKNNVLVTRYATGSYWTTGYVSEPSIFNTVIVDDGEGGMYVQDSNPRNYVGDIIYSHGIIITTDDDYNTFLREIWGGSDSISDTVTIEGKTVKNKPAAPSTANRSGFELQWQSSHPIFTHNYHCKVRESEFNFTYNNTYTSSSLGTTYDNQGDIYSTSGSINKGDIRSKCTGSAFQPYITTVGLYNDANQLIAVGKMSQPVPKPANTEMTIIVKIDI